LTDVLDAKDKIVIYSPFMAKNRLSQVLTALQSAINRGVEIYIVTKPYSEFKTSEQSSKHDCEKVLSDTGIGIIHKRKMHEKLVFIDSSILWTGSLNTLSFSDTQEVMERRQDETVFADYAQQMSIESLVGVKDHGENKVCPVCGNEMLAAESDSGGIYWTCSKCDYARNSDEPYPIDGELFCPKCGKPISFRMVNEPRWICENSHYRKARRSDLMLPKMRAKIPENQLVKVIVALSGKHSKSDVEREILKLSVISAFDDKGHLIAGFNTMQEATDFAEVSASSISKAIYGERKTSGGYQWRRYRVGMTAEDIAPLS
jgi:ribosomal protein S27AE